MVAYRLVIKKKALEFVRALPPKSQRLIVEKCKTLADDSFPGKGDKEIIQRKSHEDMFRLHISRSNTAFYEINKYEEKVLILQIKPSSRRIRYTVDFEKTSPKLLKSSAGSYTG